MGWKEAFDYMRNITSSKDADDDRREDDGLPMGARIGSMVGLQKSPLIRAQANGSLIRMPSDDETRILAASKIKLNLAGGLFRYYLAKGDDNAKETFLQVFRDAKGEIAEIMYCSQIARVIPESAEDQEAYMGVAGYGLGDASYTLWREQLGGTGLSEGELIAAFGESDRIDYARDAGASQTAFVPPFTGSEVRIDDAGGMHGLKQEIFFMPYVRELANGEREYLLITTEVVTSVDGDASKRSIHVDFVIGVPVEKERIVIQ